jgi:hypothetical protein
VPIGNISGLTTKVLAHLDIKYQMPSDFGITNKILLCFLVYFKCRAKVTKYGWYSTVQYEIVLLRAPAQTDLLSLSDPLAWRQWKTRKDQTQSSPHRRYKPPSQKKTSFMLLDKCWESETSPSWIGSRTVLFDNKD